MKIEMTDKHKHYTIAGRVVILEYQTEDKFVGRVTQTAKRSEVLNAVWTDEGECITDPEYDLLHTVNYRQLAKLVDVTYATIRIAQGTGKLGLTPVFPNNKEKVFDKRTVLSLVERHGKFGFRWYILRLYKEALAKRYKENKVRQRRSDRTERRDSTISNKNFKSRAVKLTRLPMDLRTEFVDLKTNQGISI